MPHRGTATWIVAKHGVAATIYKALEPARARGEIIRVLLVCGIVVGHARDGSSCLRYRVHIGVEFLTARISGPNRRTSTAHRYISPDRYLDKSLAGRKVITPPLVVTKIHAGRRRAIVGGRKSRIAIRDGSDNCLAANQARRIIAICRPVRAGWINRLQMTVAHLQRPICALWNKGDDGARRPCSIGRSRRSRLVPRKSIARLNMELAISRKQAGHHLKLTLLHTWNIRRGRC